LKQYHWATWVVAQPSRNLTMNWCGPFDVNIIVVNKINVKSDRYAGTAPNKKDGGK